MSTVHIECNSDRELFQSLKLFQSGETCKMPDPVDCVFIRQYTMMCY